MTRWEYRVEVIDDAGHRLAALLDELGAEGWELVGFRGFAMIFKRPRQMARDAAMLSIGA